MDSFIWRVSTTRPVGVCSCCGKSTPGVLQDDGQDTELGICAHCATIEFNLLLQADVEIAMRAAGVTGAPA